MRPDASTATAAKSPGAEKPAVAKAQAVFASSCAEKVAMRRRASASTAASNKGASAPAFANAQAVFESSWGVNVEIFFRASVETALNSCGASTLAVVKAQAVLASSCAVNVAIFLEASKAAASKNTPAFAAAPSLATPQQAFARPRASQSLASSHDILDAARSTSRPSAGSCDSGTGPSKPRRCRAVVRLTWLKSAALTSKTLRMCSA
mmetsp:Transcript_9353/g.32903  ORF Transcript_9353/g.32903 Transcript_9353/m.32903 type:complete len:208 (-) Transcript_9353:604-1227(-)